jgi:hypothetical protein|tara:strand:+ start:485 stop:1216 length:732 start_codon:yes stop_codon:yes gene_type:complete
MKVSSKDKVFNPLIVNLQTLEVGYHEKNDKEKYTIDSYYQQIKNNQYVSTKAEYLISRDLFDAQSKLTKSEFDRLCEKLEFAESTQSKYLSIGADTRLWRLFTVGKLPLKWTNQYLLTTLTDAQFAKVEKSIDCDTTASKIKQLANMDKKKEKAFEKMLLSFLQVEVENTIDVAGFETLVNKVKSVLVKIPNVNINEDKVETVLEKLRTQREKESKKEIEIAKAKQVLSDAGTSFEQAKQAVA